MLTEKGIFAPNITLYRENPIFELGLFSIRPTQTCRVEAYVRPDTLAWLIREKGEEREPRTGKGAEQEGM